MEKVASILQNILNTILNTLVTQIECLYLSLKNLVLYFIQTIYTKIEVSYNKLKCLFSTNYNKTRENVDKLIVQKSVVLEQRIGVNLLEWSRFHNRAILSSYVASKFYFLHNFFTLFNFDITGKILTYKKAAKKITKNVKKVIKNYTMDSMKLLIYTVLGCFSGTVCFIVYRKFS
jgi:hypothetical protein